jgi:hypothetical protein
LPPLQNKQTILLVQSSCAGEGINGIEGSLKRTKNHRYLNDAELLSKSSLSRQCCCFTYRLPCEGSNAENSPMALALTINNGASVAPMDLTTP